jgi:hypothetical protein
MVLFNKDNNGARELRRLTGNYFAGNDFDKVAAEIDTAADELAALVGGAVVERAERAYLAGAATDLFRDVTKMVGGGSNAASDLDATLLERVRRPIALIATLRMYRLNDLTHEDDGRKFHVATDGSEKLPWEWQLDRDDELHLEAYYREVDRLIAFLNAAQLPEWTRSEMYARLRSLLVRSGRELDALLPTPVGERMFLLLVPAIEEVQTLTLAPAYGKQWADLVAERDWQDAFTGDSSGGGSSSGGGEPDPTESPARYAARRAVALLSLSAALRQVPLQLIPGGVVRRLLAGGGIRTQAPSLDDIERVARWMERDARRWVEQMKRARDGGREPSYELLPKNDRRNKFCRV